MYEQKPGPLEDELEVRGHILINGNTSEEIRSLGFHLSRDVKRH